MSVSVQEVLCEARRLVGRLREGDSAADTLVHQTQTLYRNVQAIKEYYEDVSEGGRGGGAPLVVFEVDRQENRHILELQQENRELRDLLEEHQSALHLVMSRYRQRVTRLLSLTPHHDDDCSSSSSSPQGGAGAGAAVLQLQRGADAICEAASVMRESVRLDDLFWATERERLAEVAAEHRGLVELLSISRHYGSTPPDTAPVDKAVQTDDDPPPAEEEEAKR